ncbi:MAG: iron ABC transporter permease [Clostridiales bacterium]|nr:iron ABC transporter permease [Candidatus Crickella equi]
MKQSKQNFSNNYRKKQGLVSWALFFLLLGLILVCLCVGKYSITPGDCIKIIFGKLTGAESSWTMMDEKLLLGVRLPRVIASVLVGAALSLSGVVYQGIFKNPLVSPDFLGVSSGACIGAALAILLAMPSGLVQVFAFIGGLIAVSLTLLIPSFMRSNSNIMLVLSGIIVSGAMTSILGFIKYIADPETQLAAITYWQLGSFAYVGNHDILVVLPLGIIATVILIAMAWWINILSLGEQEAKSLGANVSLLRGICIVCSTVLTAGAVCISGTIGWVGLVVPHFGRMLIGSDNRKLLPACCIIGGIFMLLVDTVTRIIGPAEMPVSILTGIIGAPFFAWLLYRQKANIR